jgi:sugar phosphate isomerase/epimerase
MKVGMPVLYEYNSVLENIELAKALGLDFIELNLNFSYCRQQLENPEELNHLLITNHLEATLHFYDEADFASYPEVVDAYMLLLEKYATLGAKAKIKLINIHINEGPIVTISGQKNYIYEKEYTTYIENIKQRLHQAREICERNHMDLVLENVYVPHHIQKTYVELWKEGFDFNYGIGHDNNDGDRLQKVLQTTPIKFKEYHIHDGNRKTCHLALGEGTIDISKFKREAEKNKAYVVLEVKSSEDLRKSVKYFNNL